MPRVGAGRRTGRVAQRGRAGEHRAQRGLGLGALGLVLFHQVRFFENRLGERPMPPRKAALSACGTAAVRLASAFFAAAVRFGAAGLIRLELGALAQYVDVPAAVDLAQGIQQRRDFIALAQVDRLGLVVEKRERGHQRERDDGDQQMAQMVRHGVTSIGRRAGVGACWNPHVGSMETRGSQRTIVYAP